MPVSLTFLGGAGTVTGSKYLLEHCGRRLLVDCGLFQGFKALRERNWAPFPVTPRSIGTILLTHAHLDHSGYVPVLVDRGFAGQVICTKATKELCGLLLPDSGHLMEKDAQFANRRGFSRHRPALPLYDGRAAIRALESFAAVPYHAPQTIFDDCTALFRPAGHILGAATIELNWGGTRIVFSGDLGRYDSPTTVDPEPVPEADYLLVESTYGNRLHERESAEAALEAIISRTVRRGGSVIIPSFAVGRAQALLYYLSRLGRSGALARVPVFLDSPMAVNASGIFCDHPNEARLSAAECRDACGIATYVRDAEQSRSLDRNSMPKIILSASGMATGGRVLHHLKRYAPDRRNTILLTGFQAGGTRGAALRDGAREIKIHGEYVPVRAEVASLDMLSSHADRNELMHWLGGFAAAPRTTFVVHGEAQASDALRREIKEKLGWEAHCPLLGDSVELA